MKYTMIICPSCEERGTKEVLAGYREDGKFVIIRYHKAETIIEGKELTLSCGKCGELVLRRVHTYG